MRLYRSSKIRFIRNKTIDIKKLSSSAYSFHENLAIMSSNTIKPKKTSSDTQISEKLSETSILETTTNVVKNSIYWFRKAQRLHDNPALNYAIENSERVFPVFILDPFFVRTARVGANRWRFLVESLQDLDKSLRMKNSRLLVLRGQPLQVLREKFAEWNVDLLCFESDTEPYAKKRDAEVRVLARECRVQVESRWSNTLYEPGALYTKNGHKVVDWIKPSRGLKSVILKISVFKKNMRSILYATIKKNWYILIFFLPENYFILIVKMFKNVQKRFSKIIFTILESLIALKVTYTYQSFLGLMAKMGEPAAPASDLREHLKSFDDIIDEKLYLPPTLAELLEGAEITQLGPNLYPGGESEALRRMQEVLSDERWIAGFEKPNTSPNSLKPSTTVLSPYLKFGCLSPKVFYHKLKAIYRKNPKYSKPPVSLEGQLYWREFFYFCGAYTPNFDRIEGNPICRKIKWDTNPDYLK